MEIDWFTDIDGVINVFPKVNDPKNRGPHLRQWKHWEQITSDSYPILYSPDLIAEMNRIGKQANILMLTTWYETSISFFSPDVGLEATAHIARTVGLNYPLTANQPNSNKEGEWWKLNALKEHVEAHRRPFIWVDDQITSSIRRHMTNTAQAMGVPSLIITPFPAIGIEKRHIAQIDAFIEANSK